MYHSFFKLFSINYYLEDFELIMINGLIKILPLKNIIDIQDIVIQNQNDYRELKFDHPLKFLLDFNIK